MRKLAGKEKHHFERNIANEQVRSFETNPTSRELGLKKARFSLQCKASQSSAQWKHRYPKGTFF